MYEDDYEEPREVCPFHSFDCGDTMFGGCYLEEFPDEDNGYICPRSGLPALGGD